jgi:hypothetical protein
MGMTMVMSLLDWVGLLFIENECTGKDCECQDGSVRMIPAADSHLN